MRLTKTILEKLDKDPVILSHHPLCGKFDDHMIRVRGRYLCIGCMTIYPTAILAVVFLKMAALDIFPVTLSIAVAAFCMYFLRVVVRRRGARVPLNAALGVSVGAAILSAFNTPENQQFLVVVVGLAVAVTFSFLKGRRVFVKCRKCERYAEFPSCCFPQSVRPGLGNDQVSGPGLTPT